MSEQEDSFAAIIKDFDAVADMPVADTSQAHYRAWQFEHTKPVPIEEIGVSTTTLTRLSRAGITFDALFVEDTPEGHQRKPSLDLTIAEDSPFADCFADPSAPQLERYLSFINDATELDDEAFEERWGMDLA